MYAWPLAVQRAAYGQAAAFEDVGVDHSGFDAFVAQEFLNSPNIIAVFQEVCSEGVPESMATDRFVDPGSSDRISDCFLKPLFADMVAADEAAARVCPACRYQQKLTVWANAGKEQ